MSYTQEYLNKATEIIETVENQEPLIREIAKVFAHSILKGRVYFLLFCLYPILYFYAQLVENSQE